MLFLHRNRKSVFTWISQDPHIASVLMLMWHTRLWFGKILYIRYLVVIALILICILLYSDIIFCQYCILPTLINKKVKIILTSFYKQFFRSFLRQAVDNVVFVILLTHNLCVKSVHIRSYSDRCFPVFGLNTEILFTQWIQLMIFIINSSKL